MGLLLGGVMLSGTGAVLAARVVVRQFRGRIGKAVGSDG
jgi:hypothetical protein